MRAGVPVYARSTFGPGVPVYGSLAPTANPQTVRTEIDVQKIITLTGSDPEGDTLTFTIDTPPVLGSLSGTGAARQYTPNTGDTGLDTFTFHATDTLGNQSLPATVTVRLGIDTSLTGGTVVDSGGNRIHTFTANDTLGVVVAGSVNYLVVAGGGGGGNTGNGGGGGGAGGLLEGTGLPLSITTSQTITIGAAGAGLVSPTAGGASSIGSLVTTVGGGAGLTGSSTPAAGGSGAGGSGIATATAVNGGAGTSLQGNAGGQGNNGAGVTNNRGGGGGGGAGAVGGNNNATTGVAGVGGAGHASSISGSSVTYAGGGGGSSRGATGGAGGTGGGGAGASGLLTTGTAGTTNSGGGGGGGGSTGLGGAGGSGIIIVSYPSPA